MKKMDEKFPLLAPQISSHHRRVISVRMRQLEEYSLRLLDLFRDVDTAFTSRQALPKEKAAQIERAVLDLRSKIAQIKSDLALDRESRHASREAGAVLAAMTINVEELHPHYLKGYGRVPETLALYLELRIAELLGVLSEIEQVLGNPISEVRPEG